MSIASVIDHTLLRPDATPAEVDALCAEALAHGFASVCVNPCHVARCARALAGSAVAVCTVVGFPLGATTSECKAFEALQAVQNGAGEVDMVLNVGAVKAGDWARVSADILTVRAACEGHAKLKVILETCLLTDGEKTEAARAVKRAGADFVKTSTGFSSGGATAHDVALLRAAVGPELGVKASGGIRDLATARAMLAAGATRLGASAGVRIVAEEQGEAPRT